ncbi:hypothetical protein JOB18_029132 [Solea senegalensis]|uniref:FAST kinase domain-containing protein 2, mitochondrial n=1 Tax=Solea senegalensis TaxID=28829 RepID=A0AAV6RES0_SOLSE|nr:FAST kinase domain-containing protein 2, mitochondrial [Solea senegalensis]XP_043875910.1 FAST kinase domain-containing protein 2, mitochondrial [Solea senegalensis]XP_043875911.1 FAST kinase domain-containing protein 2, mitochondrial [Solea senegalensis]KAG7502950.1 FAST kinase domain-containing protein 2, mitochondrial [Solea senegalensis]KAG7502952.1 hypothetical protein JOB18_029132 [Solea senegalensis]
MMSVWVTEEVLKWTLRFCSRRTPLTHRSLLVATSIKDSSLRHTRSAHVWCTGQNQTCLLTSPFHSVRFYSQDSFHSVQEKELVSLSDERTSVKRQKTYHFVENLQRCGSPSDILDFTTQYAPTTRQVSSCLTHMWSISKKLSEEQRRLELQLMFEHPGFHRLLKRAMKCVGDMRNEDVTYSLLSIVSLGVPQHSRVVQTFLRACQANLNDYDTKSLSILASCLENMDDCPNVNALKEAMRLIVEAQIPDIQDVKSLQTMMRMSGKDAPLTLKRKLEKKALSMTDQFTLPNTHYMITTMATMGFFSKPLLDVCSKKFTENLHGTPFNRLLAVLLSCRELHYRDLYMLTGTSDYITSTMDMWSNKQLLLFLSAFEDLLFCPSSLMEAYMEKVMSCPDALTLQDLLCVLKVFSSLNYDLRQHRQQFLDGLTQVLVPYLPKMTELRLLKSVFYLCLLGHFPSEPLQQLLQPSTMECFSSTPLKYLDNQVRMFQTLDLCLRLDRPHLPCPLNVPLSVLDGPAPSSPPVNPQLSQILQSLLQDQDQAETRLQEMVLVENAYFIDAVITKPPPKETSVSLSEGAAASSPAESSQRIAVICAPLSVLCFGTSDPRGLLAVKIRHLRILGFNPVLVTEQELSSVSQEQATKLLRGRIFPEHHRSDAQLQR